MARSDYFLLGSCLATVLAGLSCGDDWQEAWSPVPGHLAEGVVGPEGGAVEVSEDGGLLFGTRIEVPPGALSEEVTITVDAPTDAQRGALPLFSEEHAVAILGPDGLTFEQPVRITVPYPAALEGDGVGMIGIDFERGDAFWVRPVAVDGAARLVTAETMHFSGYLAQRYGGPAYFEQSIRRLSEGGFAFQLASNLAPDDIGLALHDLLTYDQPTLGAVLDDGLGVGFVFVFEVHLMEKNGGWAWFDREVMARKVVYELEFALEDLSWPRVGYRVRVYVIDPDEGLSDPPHLELVTDGAMFGPDLEALLQNRAVLLSTDEVIDPEREYYLRGEFRVGDNWAPGLGNPIVLSDVSWESAPIRGSDLLLLDVDDNSDGVVDEFAGMFFGAAADDDDATLPADDDDTTPPVDDDDTAPPADDDDSTPDDDDATPDDDDSTADQAWVQVTGGNNHTCGVRATGTIACWGSNAQGQVAAPGGSFSQVGAGEMHTCAVEDTGLLQCWGGGANLYGEVTPPAGNFTEVDGGYKHNCALAVGGSLECWGLDNDGQASPPTGTYSEVSVGGYYSCAVEPGGGVECWGRNSSLQSSPPSGDFLQVDAGSQHACGVRVSGDVECWGRDDWGQAGWHAGPFIRVTAGGLHSCAIESGGAVECWGAGTTDTGNPHYGQAVPPPGIFSQIDAGFSHTCGVDDTGLTVCWGQSGFGQTSPP